MDSRIERNQKSEEASPVAFGLSLAAGILIVITAGILPLIVISGFDVMPMTGGGMMGRGMMGGMMGGGMMGGWGLYGGWFFSIPIIAGAVIVISSLMMRVKPSLNTAWSIIIIIFSVIGLLGMGLSILGSVLGIAGGIVGLSSGYGKRG
jgi:hypothetical protein